MEIKIKNSIIINPAFGSAIQNILQTRRMPARTTLEINRVIDEIATQIDLLKKSRTDIAKRYANLDNKGNPVVDANSNYVFPSDEKKLECRRALDELEAEYITVEVSSPVVLYDDENIAPLELRLLGGLVEVKERPKA
jgi:hypothetical protein